MNNKVLVVDDEAEICLLLTGMMQKLGFEASYANNLEDGKEKLNDGSYGVVFLDLNLPDGLGFHLIDTVEKNNPAAKIIIISAYDGNVERQRARTEGAHHFIPKPFSKSSIIEALDKLKINYTN